MHTQKAREESLFDKTGCCMLTGMDDAERIVQKSTENTLISFGFPGGINAPRN